MIRAEFYGSEGKLIGFKLSGHAGLAENGKDVACAAVSSSVQLMINLLDELERFTEVKVGTDTIKCIVKAPDDVSSRMLHQLRCHFEAILEEFPKTINIIISEV